MPIYEYSCNECGEEFSLIQPIGSSEEDTECVKCGSKKVHKLISSFSSFSAGSLDASGGSSFSGGG
ncbi:MAG: zinc ribbon domain-containing protein [Nitrospirota bacterium]|nr:MAG: zinc ribbon domain-containing protein [Nitrospirota bacterium]